MEKELVNALLKMWRFAGALVDKHGMNGDDTLSDREHKEWQEAAYLCMAVMGKVKGD